MNLEDIARPRHLRERTHPIGPARLPAPQRPPRPAPRPAGSRPVTAERPS
jgi:hypothetical protein